MSLTPEEVRQRFLASLRAPKAASRAPAQRKPSQVAPAPTPAPSAVAASVVRGTATSSLSTPVAQRTQPPQAIGAGQHISVPFVAKTPQSQQAAPPPRKKTVDAPSALDAVLAAERVRQGSVAFLDTPIDSTLEEAGEVPLNASYYGKKTASEEARDLASTYEGGFVALSPRSQARYEGEQQLMVEAAQQREERKKREALYEDAMRKSSGNSMDSEAEGDVRTQKANAYKQKRNDKHDSSVRDALEGDATSTTSVSSNGGVATAISSAFVPATVRVVQDLNRAADAAAAAEDASGGNSARRRESERRQAQTLWTPHSSTSQSQQQRDAYVQRQLKCTRAENSLALVTQSIFGDTSNFSFIADLCAQQIKIPSTLPGEQHAFASVRAVSRATMDEFLRTPMGDERECVQGTNCAMMRIPGCKSVILREAPPPEVVAEFMRTNTWPVKRYTCLLCDRYATNYAFFAMLPDCKSLAANALISTTHCLESEFHLQDLLFSSAQNWRGIVQPTPIFCVKYFSAYTEGTVTHVRQLGYTSNENEYANFFGTGSGSLKHRLDVAMSRHGTLHASASQPRHLPLTTHSNGSASKRPVQGSSHHSNNNSNQSKSVPTTIQPHPTPTSSAAPTPRPPSNLMPPMRPAGPPGTATRIKERGSNHKSRQMPMDF